MPWSIFDYGRDSVLTPVVNEITDPTARARVDADVAKLYANPENHDLPTLDWQGQDDVPWPTRIVVLGNAVVARYAVIEGHPEPAVIQTERLERVMEHLSEMFGGNDPPPAERYSD